MDEAAITGYFTDTFRGIHTQEAAELGVTFFCYDPGGVLPQGNYFATLERQDGALRLNVGVGKETFAGLFPAGAEHDPAAVDRLVPHEYYAAAHWVTVRDPGPATFEALRPLLAEAYALAVARHDRRAARA